MCPAPACPLAPPGRIRRTGTLNGTGALRVTVERDPSDSVIARIVAMVEEASETKAPTQLFIAALSSMRRYVHSPLAASAGA